jgi:hypothetical protein
MKNLEENRRSPRPADEEDERSQSRQTGQECRAPGDDPPLFPMIPTPPPWPRVFPGL